MNNPATNRQSPDPAAHECCGGGRESVSTWKAFENLPFFHHETDPTYQLLRSAGYRPISIASYQVRHLRHDVNPTDVLDRTEGELLSLCQRCSTRDEDPTADSTADSTADRTAEPTAEPTADQCAQSDSGTVDSRIWVAYFENQFGDCFVHVDGSGYDQTTVAQHFGGGCCQN